MASLDFSKNAENYLAITEYGEQVEDREDLVRPLWKIMDEHCPFPRCTKSAWDRVKSSLFSLESEEKCKSYLKQHGMLSTLHAKNTEDPLPEHKIDDLLRDIEVTRLDDTYEDRKTYRGQLEDQRKRKLKAEADQQQAAWKAQGKRWREQDTTSCSASETTSANVDKLANTVNTLAHSVGEMVTLSRGMAAAPSSGSAPSSHAAMVNPRLVPQFIQEAIGSAAVLDDGTNLLATHERMVSLPYSKLMLLQESIARAKEACKQGMASLVTPLDQMRIELGVLANLEQVVEEIRRGHAA